MIVGAPSRLSSISVLTTLSYRSMFISQYTSFAINSGSLVQCRASQTTSNDPNQQLRRSSHRLTPIGLLRAVRRGMQGYVLRCYVF